MKNNKHTRDVVVFDETQVSVHGSDGFLAVFTGPNLLVDANICAASHALVEALEFATSENCTTLEGWEEFEKMRDAALRIAGVKV